MKFRLLLLFTTSCIINTSAQEMVELRNQDNVFLSYELTKLKATDKRDRYLCTFKAENRNNADVYYSIPLVQQANGTELTSPNDNKAFAQLTVRNASGIFGASKILLGRETKLKTDDSKVLFVITKGEFITGEFEFNVKKDEKPVLTGTFLKNTKTIDFYDVALGESTIDGSWTSQCGTITMTLRFTKNAAGEVIIQQLVNGKINEWKKTTATTFEKSTDPTVKISYTKANQSLIYSNTDGVVCTWVKN